MNKIKNLLIYLLLAIPLAGAAPAGGKPTAPAASRPAAPAAGNPFFNPDPGKYMFENQVKPGMTGYGLTVLHGATIEKFHVRVLDVIENFGPAMNVIIVRCRGLGLRNSGVIEGMSGSPVFIDGRMIGAIAYGWPFAKKPIAGVQPIRQMLHIPLPKPGRPRSGEAAAGGGPSWMERSAVSDRMAGWSTLVRNIFKFRGQPHRYFSHGARPGPMSRAAGLVPLASPLEVSNSSPAVLRFLRRAWSDQGLTPVAAGAAGGPMLGGMATLKPGALRLVPGAAIGVPMLTGDMDMGAIGTVTDIVGNRVYAFGHRFFAQGRTALPISGAYIYTIMARLNTSFKLGATYDLQGRLIMDQQTGIVGKLGLKARSVPIAIRVHYHNPAWRRVFHYRLYPNRNTTLESLGAALLGSLNAKRKVVGKTGNYTVGLRGQFHLGRTVLPIHQVATTGFFDPNRVLVPLALLLNNPFHNLKLTSVRLKISLHATSRSAMITSIVLQHRMVAPGGRLLARVALKSYHGATRFVRMIIRVPRRTPDGDYQLIVGSANAVLLQQIIYFPQRFAPDNIASLVRDIRHLLSYRYNRIYASLVLNPHGVAGSNESQPNLPVSRIDLLARNPNRPLYPLYNSVVASAPAGAAVERGGQEFQILVRRRANERFRQPAGGALRLPAQIPLPDP